MQRIRLEWKGVKRGNWVLFGLNLMKIKTSTKYNKNAKETLQGKFEKKIAFVH